MRYGSQVGDVEYGGLNAAPTGVIEQTLDGKASLKKSTSKYLYGRANIFVPDIMEKSIYGKASLVFKPEQTITGQSRIRIVYSKILTGKSNLKIVFDKTIQGMSSIVFPTPVDQTITGKASLKLTTDKTLTGKARITFEGTDWTRITKPAMPYWDPLDNVDRTTEIWTDVVKPNKEPS